MKLPNDKYYLIVRYYGKHIDSVVNTWNADGLETMLEKVKEYSIRKPGTYILFEYSGFPIKDAGMVAYVNYTPIVGALDGKTITKDSDECGIFDDRGMDFVMNNETGEIGALYD